VNDNVRVIQSCGEKLKITLELQRFGHHSVGIGKHSVSRCNNVTFDTKHFVSWIVAGYSEIV
jgi:hypothetical protein